MKKLVLAIVLIVSFSKGNAQMKIGDTLPNTILNNIQNQAVDLSDFKGKTVLVDFWASWCAPCRVANKKLVKLHSETKNNDFEIIGISLDTDKVRWGNAVKKDKIEYTQLNEPKGFDAKVAVRFGVEELPTSYLFDKKGVLVAINPTEQEINNQINKQ
jgi:thiol-disulfide isomerase/thioredoxin